MDHGLRCWKCGASLADYSLPLRRLEECRRAAPNCTLRMCEFYDTSKAKHCREPVAEEVKRRRSQFCDYFRPRRRLRPMRSPPPSGTRGTRRAVGKRETVILTGPPARHHGARDP